MTTDEAPEWMTAAAIARRLGIGRAAVTNWRRRYRDFPSPVNHDGSARFDWGEVSRWLVVNGKGEQLARVGRTDTGTQVVAAEQQHALPLDEQSEPDIATLSSDMLLARAMVSLLPEPDEDDESPVVLDPACGAGTRLVAAAERFGERVLLAGRDTDETVVEKARATLRTHPLAGPSDLEVDGTVVRRAAAAVLCEVGSTSPGGPAGDDDGAAFAWVRQCLALLRRGGTAVVAVPARSVDHASGAATRADLVRRGVMRTVVALPTFPDSPARRLWVLRQTPARGEDVRMIDLSGLADPADVPSRAGAWRRIVDDADPAAVRDVPRVALLDGVTDLDPARHLRPRPDATAASLVDLGARLRTLYDQVSRVLPVPRPSGARPASDAVTVAELERRDALSIMVRDASPHTGDVVLRTGDRPPVVVEDDADEPHGIAQIVEVDTRRLDPHFVALFLRPEVEALSASGSHGGISREDLRRCRLPWMPLAEQRRYGQAHRRLVALHRLTADLATTTGSVLDQTVHGLTTGALTPRIEGDTA